MASLVSAFLLGIGSAASPCLLPLYPGFISFLGARVGGPERRWITGALGLAVLLGVVTAMTALALILNLLAVPMAVVLPVLIPAVDVGLVVLGGTLLTGRNPFARLGGAAVPAIRHPLGQGFAYGVFLGPLALPCAGPFLVALLAISVGLVDGLARVVIFLAYGLGFGLPLVILSVVAAARARSVAGFIARWYGTMLRLAGVLLVGAGTWDFVQNAPSILIR